jgi:hypothetical protein
MWIKSLSYLNVVQPTRYYLEEKFVNEDHIVYGVPYEIPPELLPEGLVAKTFTCLHLSNGSMIIMVGRPEDLPRKNLLKG